MVLQVRGEDFSSYLSKLSTPRELMIMMTEMFARIEAHPEGGLTAQVSCSSARPARSAALPPRCVPLCTWPQLMLRCVWALPIRLVHLECARCLLQDMEIAVEKALTQSV